MDFIRKFLTNTDETGRHIVCSLRTGKRYFVEPIEDKRPPQWGSIDPVNGGLVNKKGHDKYRGAIDAGDSLITPENGFDIDKIYTLQPRMSPAAFIETLDAKYPDRC